jgi:riboflavin-specific deaminase-like protein
METIVYRQLFPSAGTLSAAELIGSLPLVHEDPSVERPYTIVNFVVSVDGRTAVDGRSRGLSDPGDRELHRTLRERADAVLAGTGTIAADDYARMLPAPERRQRRLAAGRTAEPLAVIITRSGRLPLDLSLFAEPEARVLVFSPQPTPPSAAPAAPESTAQLQHELLDPSTPQPLTAALSTLKQRHQISTLLCEGGPTLFSALLRERLVDMLFLTIAPTLVGGPGPAVASGPPLEPTMQLQLAGVLEREGSLFLRYALTP